MNFTEPSKEGFTIYTKSGCPNCTKLKHLFKEKNISYTTVDCDEYLIEEKELFLFFIKSKIKNDYKLFPMIFYEGNFVGGYKETEKYIEELDCFNENENF
jgi:glutaredoxin